MKIVGIDPSLSATGVATWDEKFTVIKDNKLKGDARLPNIRERTAGHAYGTDLVILEDLPFNAMSAGATGMAQGVIREALNMLCIPYVGVSPATLKKAATGKGNAKKDVMVACWNAAFPEHPLKDDNMVDAGWLREIGKALAGLPHRLADTECLDKIRPAYEQVMA